MAATDHLRRVKTLYHFTDASNLASIRENDGLWSTAKLREMGIGFHPGGNEQSLTADAMFGMDKFVHLSFTRDHPMAYIAKRDKRVNDLRWLYIDDSDAVLEIEGVRYCEEVANKSGTELCSIEYARETFDEVALFEFLDCREDDAA